MALVKWGYFLGGNWNVAGYWSTDSVPMASDDVRITIPGIFVTSNGDVTINSIGITEMSGLTITGESTFNDINGTGLGANHGYIKIIDNSTMQVIQGTFDNAGTIYLGASGTYNTFMINT